MATLVSIGTSQRHCWVGCSHLYQPDRLHLILGSTQAPRSARPSWAVILSLWPLYRAQNASYQGLGDSERARDGRRLDARPERRPDKVCSSFRDLVDLSNLLIAGRCGLAFLMTSWSRSYSWELACGD